jgi:hypothetical protein
MRGFPEKSLIKIYLKRKKKKEKKKKSLPDHFSEFLPAPSRDESFQVFFFYFFESVELLEAVLRKNK